MRRRLLAGVGMLSALLCLLPLSAVSEEASVSAEPFLSLRHGSLFEYVFLKASAFPDDTLSRLDWDYGLLLYAGVQVSADWHGLCGGLSVQGAFPMECGSMYDSDWQNNALPGMGAAYDYRTNFSESANSLDSAVAWGVRGGYGFPTDGTVRITAYAAFEYDHKAFTATGGTYWYGNTEGASGYSPKAGPWYPADDREHCTTGSWEGKVIGYERTTCTCWLGADVLFSAPFGLELGGGFAVAPYVWTKSVDKHYLTGVQYADIAQGAFRAFRFSLEARKALTGRLCLRARGAYCSMGPVSGESYYTWLGGSEYRHDGSIRGGAAERWFEASLSLRYALLRPR